MIHPLISPTLFANIRFMIYVLIKSFISLNPIILFMIIGDILLVSYLFYVIYRSVMRLLDSSYFFFDTVCNKSIIDDQMTKFMTILKSNAQKTINTLKHTDGISDNFDLETISDIVDTHINSVIKQDIIINIKCTKKLRLEVDIKKYINDISQLVCCELNKIAYEKNKLIRFTFIMEKKGNSGSFIIIIVAQHKTVNNNHSVYSVSDCSNKKIYYLTEYTCDMHKFLTLQYIRSHRHYGLQICNNINILETTIIDGTPHVYIMINHDNYRSPYDIRENDIIESINSYTREKLAYL